MNNLREKVWAKKTFLTKFTVTFYITFFFFLNAKMQSGFCSANIPGEETGALIM